MKDSICTNSQVLPRFIFSIEEFNKFSYLSDDVIDLPIVSVKSGVLLCDGVKFELPKNLDSGFICHEMFVLSLFGSREKRLPNKMLTDDGISDILSEPSTLTPDNWFCYRDRVHVTEVKTTEMSRDETSIISRALLKYDIYPPGVCTRSVVLVTGESCTTFGMKFDKKSLMSSYKIWISCKEFFGSLAGRSPLEEIYHIPKISMLAFPSDPLTYDDSWIETLRSTTPMNVNEYKTRHGGTSTDSLLKVREPTSKNPPLTELPLILPQIGDEMPSIMSHQLDQRRAELIRNLPAEVPSLIKINPVDPSLCINDILRGHGAKKFAADFTGDFYAKMKRGQIPSDFYNYDPARLTSIGKMLEAKRLRKKLEVYNPIEIDFRLLLPEFLVSTTTTWTYDQSSVIQPIDKKPQDEAFENSFMMQYSIFISFLVAELNVVRASAAYKTRRGRYHYSKVGPYNAYLITSCSGTDSSVFYDLILKKDSSFPYFSDSIFRELEGGWYMSSYILSMNPPRMNQLLAFPYKLRCVYEFFKRFELPELYSLVTFMITLDGKQETLDILQYFRYIYMKQTCLFPRITGCINKCNKHIRTWMQAVLVKKMLDQREVLSEVTLNEDGSVSLGRMENWITGEIIKTPEEMISLSYMHYSCQAKENDTAHGTYKCLEKILKEEILLKDTRIDSLKVNDPEFLASDKLSHEYSRPFVKSLGILLSKDVKKKVSSVRSMIRGFCKQVRLDLSREKFATMKKSTVKENDKYKRVTCAEALLKFTGLSHDCLVDDMVTIQNHLLTEEGRAVTIFKKDQQTGIREIFVMPISMRITMAFNELFCKYIAKYIGNEMISEPSLREHFDTIHRSRCFPKPLNSVQIDMTSSSDAQTWCQRWIMPNLLDFIVSFLESLMEEEEDDWSKTTLMDIRNSFINGLNSITHKRIYPDVKMMNTAMNIPDDLIISDEMRELKRIMKGTSHLNFEEDNNCFKNRSNMMQGVPHLLSSLLHATYLNKITRSAEHILSKYPGVKRAVVSSQVSSDDSSILMTVFVDEDLSKERIIDIKSKMATMLMVSEVSKTEMGAYPSMNKSTIATQGKLKEFNSCWSAGLSNYYASLKFITSAFGQGYHPILRDRVSSSLSNIMQLYKEGLKANEIYEITKALQIYNCSMLIPRERQEFKDYLTTSCASLGVIPVLPQRLVGLFNLDITEELAYKFTGRSSILWGRDISPSLTFGKNHKYINFLRRNNITRELLLEKIPSDHMEFLIAGFPDPADDIKFKMLSPGIVLSFSYCPNLRIHSASSYALQNEVVRVYNETDTSEKLSLTQLIAECRSSPPVVNKQPYPCNSTYQKFLDDLVFSNFSVTTKSNSYNRQKRYTTKLTPYYKRDVNLKDLVLSKWRGEYLTTPDLEVLDQLRAADVKYRDSLNEMLESYDILVIKNWLESLVIKKDTLSFILPSYPDRDPFIAYQMNLVYNYSHNKKCILVERSTNFHLDPENNISYNLTKADEITRRLLLRPSLPFKVLRDYMYHEALKLKQTEDYLVTKNWVAENPVVNLWESRKVIISKTYSSYLGLESFIKVDGYKLPKCRPYYFCFLPELITAYSSYSHIYRTISNRKRTRMHLVRNHEDKVHTDVVRTFKPFSVFLRQCALDQEVVELILATSVLINGLIHIKLDIDPYIKIPVRKRRELKLLYELDQFSDLIRITRTFHRVEVLGTSDPPSGVKIPIKYLNNQFTQRQSYYVTDAVGNRLCRYDVRFGKMDKENLIKEIDRGPYEVSSMSLNPKGLGSGHRYPFIVAFLRDDKDSVLRLYRKLSRLMKKHGFNHKNFDIYTKEILRFAPRRLKKAKQEEMLRVEVQMPEGMDEGIFEDFGIPDQPCQQGLEYFLQDIGDIYEFEEGDGMVVADEIPNTNLRDRIGYFRDLETMLAIFFNDKTLLDDDLNYLVELEITYTDSRNLTIKEFSGEHSNTYRVE
uniref:RNA-directed RNA polymerase L n=1 Tax=Rasbo virus TaxID=2651932 RepID=A0A5Q0TWT2_9VIRU|nr:RNA-dependent RNA polymerase [Rasbo virus]